MSVWTPLCWLALVTKEDSWLCSRWPGPVPMASPARVVEGHEQRERDASTCIVDASPLARLRWQQGNGLQPVGAPLAVEHDDQEVSFLYKRPVPLSGRRPTTLPGHCVVRLLKPKNVGSVADAIVRLCVVLERAVASAITHEPLHAASGETLHGPWEKKEASC